MPKFKVLRPIEVNGTLYLPIEAIAPAKAKSCGNGQDLAADNSGFIELSDEQAAEMRDGQLQAVSDSKPASSKKKTPKGESEG